MEISALSREDIDMLRDAGHAWIDHLTGNIQEILRTKKVKVTITIEDKDPA